MLTYRGDKYVKGKKFKINESTYFFSKYDGEDYLIFEAEDKRSQQTPVIPLRRLCDACFNAD